MVLAPGPVFEAVEAISPPRPLLHARPGWKAARPGPGRGAGRAQDVTIGRLLAALRRYEGVDQRATDHLVDGELSVGDYVLAGGEAAACVVVEAVARLVPGVMGNEASSLEESFGSGLLEYPEYTRPAEIRGPAVPRSCEAAIIVASSAGAGRRPFEGPSSDVPTWSRPGRLSDEEHQLLEELGELEGGGSATDKSPESRRGGRRTILVVPAPSWAGLVVGPGGHRGLRGSTLKGTRAMNPTDIVDRESLRDDVPDFAPGDSVEGSRPRGRGSRQRDQVFQGAVNRGARAQVLRDLHGSKAQLRRGGRADVSSALPGVVEDRGGDPRGRASCEALLPAWPCRQGGEDQREAVGSSVELRRFGDRAGLCG